MSFGGPNYPMASLYVGDLHPSINEAMLFEKFSAVGQVLSVRVCRHANTQQSLGYAYVNFQRPGEAARALDTMNFDVVNGRPIRIMWSQRDPSLRKSNASNLFIKNLEKSIDNKALYDTFSAFGKICSCKVALDDNGNSKGYGFVHFETEADAVKTISTVNGMLLNGKKVYVGKFIPRAEREKLLGNRANVYTNVYVNNFGRYFTKDQLKALFGEYGVISSHTIMKDEKGTSRGFGFVAFEKPECAKAAVDGLNGKELIKGCPLYVGRAQSKRERLLELKRKFELLATKYQDVNLYVKNLDESIDDKDLKSLFSIFGTITSAVVMKEQGKSRGFGFVCFSKPSEATKAVAEMNGKMLTTKPLYVGLAQRKEDRRTLLSAQFTKRIANTRMHQIGQASNYYVHPAVATSHMYPAPGPSRVPQYNMYYNMPRNVPNNPKVVPHQGPVDSPLTASILASAPPQQQKQMLGERLYPLIQRVYPKLVGKITGMILEIDNAEILHMLEDNEALQTKIREALSALKLYQVPS